MNVYCIGIGGIGVSGVARLLKFEGHHVSGSDSNSSIITDALRDDGIPVHFDQTGRHLSRDTDIVVYSVAVSENHPELRRALDLGIPAHTYAEVLGEYSRHKRTIAVCGSHGKTTTTGMLTSVFVSSGAKPSALVGSLMKDFGGLNVIRGADDMFIVEACEYRMNFASLHPKHALVTNIELDHCDYFASEEHYFRAFHSFLRKVPINGIVVMKEQDGPKVDAKNLPCRVIYYDSFIDELRSRQDFQLKVFGDHNIANAACVYAFAQAYGIQPEKILRGLALFSGTWRRMEYKGGLKGASVFDDYAHHPTEVRATLAAFRKHFPDKTIRAVFQPHQHSRTRFFLQDFAQSFQDADEVIVPNIYRARDSEQVAASISVGDLVSEIGRFHKNVRNGGGLDETAQLLSSTAAENQIIVVMGAGDVTKIHSGLDLV